MPPYKSKYGYGQPLADSPPNFAQTLRRIEALELPLTNRKRWVKAALILMALTGGRVSEINQVCRHHVIFRNGNLDVFPKDNLDNVTQVLIRLKTLKQKDKNKMRNVEIPVTEITRSLLSWFAKYCFAFKPEDKLIKYKRDCILKNVKRYFDPNFYPHLFRKILATTDGQMGMSAYSLQRKFGWSQPAMPFKYAKADDNVVTEQYRRVLEQVGVEVKDKKAFSNQDEHNFDGIVIKKRLEKPILVKKRLVL